MKYILTDKKRIGIIMTLLLVAGLFLGCSSKEETENNAPSMENQKIYRKHYGIAKSAIVLSFDCAF